MRVSTLQSTGGVSGLALNTDGTVIAFDSTASDPIPGDLNDAVDVFVSDLNCPTDSDSDATLDCSDACPFDALKIVAGSCGCGTAETDTDTDATPDCNDSCPTDAAKTSEGTCGCGISDIDTNSNGVADCLDPTTSTVPSKPSVSKNHGSLLARVPVRYAGATYQYQVRRGATVVASRSTAQRQVRFRNLRREPFRFDTEPLSGA